MRWTNLPSAPPRNSSRRQPRPEFKKVDDAGRIDILRTPDRDPRNAALDNRAQPEAWRRLCASEGVAEDIVPACVGEVDCRIRDD